MIGNTEHPENDNGVVANVEEPEEEEEEERQRWESRLVFILASIGSAVGLGNVWRFPYLVTKYGGGTFLIPYTVCLFGIGMPILLMELALGQQFQGGDVEAFGKMHPRLRGIGMASIFSSFTIIAYYCVIIAWTVIYFFQSCKELEWTTVADANNYFDNDLLNIADLAELGGNSEGSWRVLMGLILTWFAIYWCIYKGVLSAGIVVKITMPLPVLILIILMIRSVMLPGAGGGLEQYLGNWKMDVLEQRADNQIWAAATGQVFFTLGVCMGVMTAYSSFNPKNQNIVVDEKFISLGDYSIAFFAGFTIYAIMGHLVHECSGLTTAEDMVVYDICTTSPSGPDDVDCQTLMNDKSLLESACNTIYNSSGMGLAFKMYPFGLSLLPGAKFWCAIFFLMLFTLGVDSAFSLVEAVTTVIGDSQVAKRMKWTKSGISMVVCLALFFIGTLFTFDTGLGWLDIVDYYVNSFCLLLVGFFECVATGWVYKCDEQAKAVGGTSIAIYNFGSALALLLGCAIGFGLTKPTYTNGSLTSWDDGAVDSAVAAVIGVCTALFIWSVSIALAFYYAEEPEQEDNGVQKNSVLWSIMGWHGCDSLRTVVNQQNHPDWQPNTTLSELTALFSGNTMPFYFGLFIKYVDPLLLALMIVDTWRSNSYDAYGNYKPSQLAVGWLIFSVALCLGIFPIFCPVLMMSNKHAQAFEGWDLSIQIASYFGIDLLNSSFLGFSSDAAGTETVKLKDDPKDGQKDWKENWKEPTKDEDKTAETEMIPRETTNYQEFDEPENGGKRFPEMSSQSEN